jgi:predicted AAA+ superfamily ATPase
MRPAKYGILMSDSSFPLDVTALAEALQRIAAALERLAPPPAPPLDLTQADAFLWQAAQEKLIPVPVVARVELALLVGIDRQASVLLENTRRFARGLPANNALLWGARGMGKSSLVKAAHATVNAETDGGLALVEIQRDDIASLPALLEILRGQPRRCLILVDDLSFDADDSSYKSLKAVLDGGIEGRPANVLFYATSNRRHLLARDMIDNERSTAINPGDAVEEKVSLSDRFGLWLGFHGCDQPTYFAMVDAYARHFALDIAPDALHAQANEWSMIRGARSGRVAWQFIQDLAGRLGRALS